MKRVVTFRKSFSGDPSSGDLSVKLPYLHTGEYKHCTMKVRYAAIEFANANTDNFIFIALENEPSAKSISIDDGNTMSYGVLCSLSYSNAFDSNTARDTENQSAPEVEVDYNQLISGDIHFTLLSTDGGDLAPLYTDVREVIIIMEFDFQ